MQRILARVFSAEFRKPVRIINGDTPRAGNLRKGGIETRSGILQEFRQSDGFDVLILSPFVAGVGLTIVEAKLAVRVKNDDDADPIPAWIHALHSGDEVFWTDPDGGRCSRPYTIQTIEIHGDSIRIMDRSGDYLECYASELSN